MFPGGEVPFKAILLSDDGKDDHSISAKYYALAHRAGRVHGPPVALAVINMHSDGIVEGVLDGSVVVKPRQYTFGFRKLVNTDNYPYLQADPIIHFLIGQSGQLLLEQGQMLLE